MQCSVRSDVSCRVAVLATLVYYSQHHFVCTPPLESLPSSCPSYLVDTYAHMRGIPLYLPSMFCMGPFSPPSLEYIGAVAPNAQETCNRPIGFVLHCSELRDVVRRAGLFFPVKSQSRQIDLRQTNGLVFQRRSRPPHAATSPRLTFEALPIITQQTRIASWRAG